MNHSRPATGRSKEVAAELNPVNYTSMDHLVPEEFRKVMADVALDKNSLLHQYTNGIGLPRLRKNVAKLYSPLVGRDLDQSTEILVTCGANEALHSAISGHVDKGDEVILIEPCYESYVPLILQAGGVPRYVPLTLKHNSTKIISSSSWSLDFEQLATTFNPRTKMIILNNPHSPFGKVFSREELEEIAGLCRTFDVICVADEVLEWMVFEPATHVRIATLPGMWERTITICSASKTFQVPGWKVGWAYGNASLMRNLKVVYQNSGYTPLQEAIARLLESEMTRQDPSGGYFSATRRNLLRNRDRLVDILEESGLKPTIPEAGYCIIAGNKTDLSRQSPGFTQKLEQAGVVATPLASMYSEGHKQIGSNFAVICYGGQTLDC